MLVLLRRGAARGARALAVGAVVAVIWGWGVAQHPYLLPETLTIDDGRRAERHADRVLIVFGVAVVLVVPSIALLFTLAQRGLIEEGRAARAAAVVVVERAPRARASEGKMRTERTAALTNAAAVLECMWPCWTPIVVMATTSGSCVDANSASAPRSAPGSSRR